MDPANLNGTGGGRFRAGHDPRRNLAGRPRSGLALSEAIRARIDPRRITDMLLAFADDEQIPLERRLATLLPWVQLGFVRPPTAASLRVESVGGEAPQRDWGALPLHERRTLLEMIRRAPLLPAGGPATDDSE